ncbi:hypothetical protein RB601_003866 [Gaeumannomyces tritici]
MRVQNLHVMGTTIPPRIYRFLNMRSPFGRAIVLAAISLILISLSLHSSSSSELRRAVLVTTDSFRQHGGQRPLSNTPVWPSPSPPNSTENTAGARFDAETMGCEDDFAHLRKLQVRYGLQPKFEYYRRHVQISRQDIERSAMTEVDERFLPGEFRLVDTETRTASDTPCPGPEPLHLPVTKSPFPSTANLSDFLFGVSTTYKRFSDPRTSSVDEWAYWLTDSRGRSNGGKLLLLLIDASWLELRATRNRLKSAGIDADVQRSDSKDPMAVRYLSLVPAMYGHPARWARKWLVACDDDTFFPSPHALVERMARFDTSRPLYVGTLSEDASNVDRHGAQAFGGAGVFISVPLASEVAAAYDSCRTERKVAEADSGWGPQGDILLRKCIYENTPVRLSMVPELWQLDLMGDPSGFYESGIKPLSLHHYRGGMWHIGYPLAYTRHAHLCGEDCTLQRFRTRDGFVLSAGFSVARYPLGMDDLDTDQMERTFWPAPDDKGWNLDFALGTQRRSLARTGRKLSWDLQESALRPDGSVSQIYVRKAEDQRWVDWAGNRMSENDGVVELVWIL